VAMWNDYNFQVIDTGGIVFDGEIHYAYHYNYSTAKTYNM